MAQKTLDGQTATLIASIAHALPRTLTGERIQHWITNPERLQEKLLSLDEGEGESAAAEERNRRQALRLLDRADTLLQRTKEAGFTVDEYDVRTLRRHLVLQHVKGKRELLISSVSELRGALAQAGRLGFGTATVEMALTLLISTKLVEIPRFLMMPMTLKVDPVERYVSVLTVRNMPGNEFHRRISLLDFTLDHECREGTQFLLTKPA